VKNDLAMAKISSYRNNCTLVFEEHAQTANKTEQKNEATSSDQQTTGNRQQRGQKHFSHKAELVNTQKDSSAQRNASENLQRKRHIGHLQPYTKQ